MEFYVETIGRLLLASFLGGLVGLEREIHGRPAGFRTHLLVSLGACLFVVTSIHFYRLYGNIGGGGPLGVDPGRVAAQVVTGIGFLGAGAIIREGTSVRGLTTAACLWVVAAIGVACGVGLFFISTVVTVVAILNLLLLKKVEGTLSRDVYSFVKVWSEDLEGQISGLEKLLAECRMDVIHTIVEKDMERREIYLEFEVRFSSQGYPCRLLEDIAATPGVRRVRLD